MIAGSKCRHLNGELFCFTSVIPSGGWTSRRADDGREATLQHYRLFHHNRLKGMSETSPHCYEFGPYRLDPVERTLSRGGGPVRITPKDFEVLLLLILNGGNVVEKGRLLQEVWPDTFVEDANLAVHVARLRKTLGRRPDGGPYIETVPRRGYRFATAVREVRRKEATPAADQAPYIDALERGRFGPVPSLAILPLVNTGDEGVEYLSEGIAESIISALSHQSRLRVLARGSVFRYKGQDKDPVEVGRELGADAVLTGRIVQLGERMIIRVELTEVSNGWELWGAQYDSGPTDLLSIQGEVSRQISESLRLRLSRAEEQLLTKRHTESVEALHLYLRGRHHWAKYTVESLKIGMEYFRMALEADPTYALAYVGLAESYMRLSEEYLHPKEAIPKAKAAALRALQIDETLAEPHATLALIRARHEEWDWATAERDLRRALELKPGYALAHQWYASLLQALGRFEEALAELAIACELDPLSLQISVSKAATFYLMRKYDRASELCANVLEMEPCHFSARLSLGSIYLKMGRYDEAIAELQIALQLNNSVTARGCLGLAHAVAGNSGEARKLLGELMSMSASQYVSPYSIALIHTGLGEREMALRWLERAFEEESEWLSWLKTDPRLDGLRSEARFADLLKRVRLQS